MELSNSKSRFSLVYSRRAQAEMIEHFGFGVQTGFDVPQAFALRQLYENHADQLLATAKISDPSFGSVTLDEPIEKTERFISVVASLTIAARVGWTTASFMVVECKHLARGAIPRHVQDLIALGNRMLPARFFGMRVGGASAIDARRAIL